MEQRDAIGIEFFKFQGNSTCDAMMLALDHWSLLSMGVLDAMARIAFRAYGIPANENKAGVNFATPDFVARLEKHGAPNLATLLRSVEVSAFAATVKALRNMIHGASYVPVQLQNGNEEGSRLRVPDREAAAILTAVQSLGAPTAFGVTQDYGLLVEPFTLATRLTESLFSVVNEIAEATEVERLFGSSGPTEPLPSFPPADLRHFDPGDARRFDALA